VCGICGIVREPGHKVDLTLIGEMTDLMRHRGPDERGVWVNPSGEVGLGARRLSIIGVANGSQPILNEDQSCALVANGEIYNYKTLKNDLVVHGHKFATDTDVEVILHLYEQEGLSLAKLMNGMFAFAIWDQKRERLVLCRDRMGIKPLFYMQLRDRVVFASEIKSIICDPSIPRELDLQAMHDYFTFDYVPGEQTIFKGVREVQQGCTAVFERGAMRTIRYWDLSYNPDVRPRPIYYYEERLRDLLSESVRKRLMSEVPVGVLLSGGMDSSAIAAYVARHSSQRVKTFSIGFKERSFDERRYARMIARRFGTEHHEMVLTARHVLEVLESQIRCFDEPFADGAAIPTWHLCKMAGEHITVALSGEGGDEAFAGYDTHAAYRLASWLRWMPAFLRDGVARPLVDLIPVSDKKVSFDFRAKRFIRGIGLPVPEAHLFWRVVLTEAEKSRLYSAALREQMRVLPSVRIFADLFEKCNAKDALNRLLYIDSKVFLPDDLFVKNDRMSMAHSLETRVPMTDPDLLDFASTIPPEMKLKGLRTKHILRDAMRGMLPNPITKKKKVGFDMPLGKWLKRELYDFMQDAFRTQKLRDADLFDWKFVDRMIEEHVSNRRNNGRPLWGLLNFALWYDAYM